MSFLLTQVPSRPTSLPAPSLQRTVNARRRTRTQERSHVAQHDRNSLDVPELSCTSAVALRTGDPTGNQRNLIETRSAVLLTRRGFFQTHLLTLTRTLTSSSLSFSKCSQLCSPSRIASNARRHVGTLTGNRLVWPGPCSSSGRRCFLIKFLLLLDVLPEATAEWFLGRRRSLTQGSANLARAQLCQRRGRGARRDAASRLGHARCIRWKGRAKGKSVELYGVQAKEDQV